MNLFPRKLINFYPNEINDIRTLFSNGEVLEGGYIEQFEDNFAQYVGSQYAVAVSQGREALRLILKCLSLGPRSEVVLPAYTDPSVPQAIKDSGCIPVFVDISLEDFNINVNKIEEKITSSTRVIIATHIYGSPCNLNKILKISHEYNLILIEDCVHALGAEYNGKKIGNFGIASYFSFSNTKSLNTFGGGMIVSSNPELINKIKVEISGYKYPNKRELIKNIFLAYLLSILTKPIIFAVILYPSLYLSVLTDKDLINLYKKFFKKLLNQKSMLFKKYSNLQALIGLRNLENLDVRIKKQRFNVRILEEALNREVLKQAIHNDFSIYYSYILKVRNKKELKRKLLSRGIDAGDKFMCNCAEYFGDKQPYINTKKAIEMSLQLPINHSLKESQINFIAKQINKFWIN